MYWKTKWCPVWESESKQTWMQRRKHLFSRKNICRYLPAAAVKAAGAAVERSPCNENEDEEQSRTWERHWVSTFILHMCLCVCMCVHMCVCVYMCLYAYISVCMYTGHNSFECLVLYFLKKLIISYMQVCILIFIPHSLRYNLPHHFSLPTSCDLFF